jgi:hypothetical protein
MDNPLPGTAPEALPVLWLCHITLCVCDLAVCLCHPLLLGPPWLCSNSVEYGSDGSAENLQMTLVKLHACQYPEVK